MSWINFGSCQKWETSKYQIARSWDRLNSSSKSWICFGSRLKSFEVWRLIVLKQTLHSYHIALAWQKVPIARNSDRGFFFLPLIYKLFWKVLLTTVKIKNGLKLAVLLSNEIFKFCEHLICFKNIIVQLIGIPVQFVNGCRKLFGSDEKICLNYS